MVGEDTDLYAEIEGLRERFADGPGSRDLMLSLICGRQLTDKVRLEIQGQRIQRSDSLRDFDEIRAFLTFRFTLRALPRGENWHFSIALSSAALERAVASQKRCQLAASSHRPAACSS